MLAIHRRQTLFCDLRDHWGEIDETQFRKKSVKTEVWKLLNGFLVFDAVIFEELSLPTFKGQGLQVSKEENKIFLNSASTSVGTSAEVARSSKPS